MNRYKTQIYFDQCDPAGIIFYGRVFDLAHRAFEQLVIDSGIDWSQWFAAQDFVVPIVHAEVDFASPLRAGIQVEIETCIERIGVSSVTFAYRVVGGKVLYATAKTVHVFMDRSTSKKINIPESIKSLLTKHQS